MTVMNIFLSRKKWLSLSLGVLAGLLMTSMNVQAEPKTMSHSDLLALIEDSHRKIDSAVSARTEQPMAFVAVSLSMPEGSLLKLAQDAKDAGIGLIVRGVPVKEKTMDTTKKSNPTVKEKYGTHLLVHGMKAFEPLVKTGVTLQIDPRAFELLGINDVPQLVLVKYGQGPNAKPESLRVRGDVSLAYGLSHLEDSLLEKEKTTSLTDFEVQVKSFIAETLKRLGGRP